MARSEAPQDPRPYIRVSTDLPLHPKLAAMDNPAAGWTYVVSLCYCGQSLTDGHFPMAAVLRMSGTDKALAEALVEQGLWHLPGHDCPDCEQPRQGHAIVHDYLQHQRSSAEVRELTEKRRAAGRQGAAKRWGTSPEPSDRMASAMANAKQVPWQTDSKPIAEERRGEEIEKKTSSSSGGTATRAASQSKSKRGSRIPDDFTVTADMVTWAKQRAPLADGRTQTEMFVNHFRAASGSNAVKRDWDAAWRNWMLRAQGDAERYNRPRTAAATLPPSSAPITIPIDQRCPKHRGQRLGNCGPCRASALGKNPEN